MKLKSHSLRGSVDWNSLYIVYKDLKGSHSLRGSVDWNSFYAATSQPCCQSLPAWECGLKSTRKLGKKIHHRRVTPCVGVWIEIKKFKWENPSILVTPCVGVWIEIVGNENESTEGEPVTPCVGVWIEIYSSLIHNRIEYVTPCVGVWIEIASSFVPASILS